MTETTIKNSDLIAGRLSSGASADIWYDAHEYDAPEDRVAENTIEQTQSAMQDAARLLPQMTELLRKFHAFASDMAEKHGMNGDDTMTDEEHATFQEIGGAANVLFQELDQEIVLADDADDEIVPTI